MTRPSSSPAIPPTGLLFRPAAARFHSQLDWLESWHTFSFASHVDPAWMGFGPLRVINDDRIAAGCGFGMHPHRDMEIVTVMVEGQLHHRDSLGHTAVLRAGEVQRMSAGTGVVHSEMNTGAQPCRLLQIWIEPDQRGTAPAYEQQPFAIGSGWTPLIDPHGAGGAMAIQRAVRLWRARPLPGGVLRSPLHPARLGWLQVIDGGLEGPWRLGRGDGLGLQPGEWREPLVADGQQGADLLLFELA